MNEVETARAFWTALGQIAGVFAIPLVLEARRSAARWRTTRRSARRLQSLFYVLAAYAIYDAVAASLSALMTPSLDMVAMTLRTVSLTAVAAGLVLNPVLTFWIESNRDLLIIGQRAIPWSRFRRLRRAVRRNEAAVVTLATTVLNGLDTLDEQEQRLLILQTRRTAQDNALNSLANSVPDGQVAGSTRSSISDVSNAEARRSLLDQIESAKNDPVTTQSIAEELKKLRKTRKIFWKKVIELDQIAQYFDEARPFFRVTYLDPELHSALESNIANVAADAADNLTNPVIQAAEILSPTGSALKAVDKLLGENLRTIVNDSASTDRLSSN